MPTMQEFKTIWRIETPSGDGMYMWGAYERIFCDDISDSGDGGNHPSPFSDSGMADWWKNKDYDERDNYYFGFGSRRQMEKWVYLPKWRRALAEHGLRLNKYLVPASLSFIGNTQAVFKRSDAKLIESYSPDHFDRL